MKTSRKFLQNEQSKGFIDYNSVFNKLMEFSKSKTPAQLCEKLGISQSTLKGWEYTDKIDLQRVLSQMPDISFDYLLRNDDTLPKTYDDLKRELTKEQTALKIAKEENTFLKSVISTLVEVQKERANGNDKD